MHVHMSVCMCICVCLHACMYMHVCVYKCKHVSQLYYSTTSAERATSKLYNDLFS